MKKLLATLLAGLFLFLAGCGTTSEGTAHLLERSQAMPPAESSAAEPILPAPSPSPAADEASTSTPPPKATPSPTPKAPAPEPTAVPKPTAPPKAAPGAPEYSLSSSRVKAGDMLTLTCENPPPLEQLKLQVTVSGTFQFIEDGDRAVALIGISRSTKPGSYQATINGTEVLPFTVVDAGFESEAFEMDTSVTNSTVSNNTAREEYNRITASVMATSTADPAFPDLNGFMMPITQPTFRVSSSYGFTRIVNGKVSGRHEGIDFPAPKGTPVVAAGDGRVLYAGLMKMTGNTVVIEHGFGLKSWYHHMDSLSCATGDVLKAGDPVGKVGTTGYSTGNHLHFGMSINDTYTNPWQFIPKPS